MHGGVPQVGFVMLTGIVGAMFSEAAVVAQLFKLSHTWIEKLKAPPTVGMPSMTPVVGWITSPVGNVPFEMFHP